VVSISLSLSLSINWIIIALSTPNPAASQTDLLQDEASRLEMVQAFQRLKVAGDIIPSKPGTNEMQTNHSLHNHLRARLMKLAQNKRACTSTKVWVHDSDDDKEEGELEEPFDAPWDEHVGPESIATAYVHGTETAHTAAHARRGVWSSDMTKQAKSIFANNICVAAMLGFREDIRRSQFAWAQTWNNGMQASMLDPAETLEGFWAAQDILKGRHQSQKGSNEKSVRIRDMDRFNARVA